MNNRITFTKRELDDLEVPAAGTRSTVYDVKVPKLAVRVTSTGAKSFYLVRRTGRGMTWLRLGKYPDMTIENARKAAEAALGDFATGGNPAAKRRAKRAEKTLGEAFEDYLAERIRRGECARPDEVRATWQRYLGDPPEGPRKKHGKVRTKHAAGVNWQRRPVGAITGDDVEALHRAIGKVAPIAANRVVEMVSAIYGFIKVDNPAAAVEPFKERKRKRFLKAGELPRFFAALEADTSADFRDFILLALLTGQRRENLLSMRWRHIDQARAVWSIPEDEAKAGEQIEVPLVPAAVEILSRRRAAAEVSAIATKGPRSPFVFPANSASGHLTPPKKRWSALLDRIELDELRARIAAVDRAQADPVPGESLDRALQRARSTADALHVDRADARVEDVRLHDLRRSLGSWQAIQGASLLIIGKSLGHRSASATEVYAHLALDPVRASVERATDAMLHAAGVKQPGGGC